MNPGTLGEAQKLFDAIQKGVRDLKSKKDLTIAACPPFPFLLHLKSKILNLKLGSQDCFWENEGAYTGEVSPSMLKEIGCEYVIFGHSERRIHLGETDGMIAKKVKAALEIGLNVVLCIGENLDQRKAGQTKEVLESQLEADLGGIRNLKFEIKNLFIAYEPVWAISGFNGKAASVQDIAQATGWIRGALKKKFGKEGELLFVIYGGSVKSESVQEYLWGGGINGFLVGSASLDPHEFFEIIKQCQC